LSRWDGWTAPAKEYLNRQAAYFNLAPIIERYVNAAGQFAAWFWAEINGRSAALIDEITTKATELKLWHDENVGTPDWFDRGESGPPPGWNGRLWRAGQRKARYEHGTSPPTGSRCAPRCASRFGFTYPLAVVNITKA
jgi:hypothetical protein